MEMEKRTPRKESCRKKGRDKIEMAWRHKSRSEKNLIKVIGVLAFALLCFIIAVTAMDFAFKAKIKDLEDEIDHLKTDQPDTSTFTSTGEPDYNTTVVSSTKELTTSQTTTLPPSTTSTALETSTSTSSETTSDSSTSTKDSGTTTTVKGTTDPIFEALRSLLTNFSGLKTSTKSIEESTQRGSITSRSHGTFIIMADINHEESKSITPKPAVAQDPFVYIDSSGSPSGMPQGDDVNKATARPNLDSLFDDTEDDLEATTEDINRQGSGDGTHEHTVPP